MEDSMKAFIKKTALCLIFPLVVLVMAPPASPQSADDGLEWPRQIIVPQGKVVIYQPQPESLEGNILESRAAVSVTPKDKTEPVFGAVWFKAQVETDRDAHTVSFVNVKVPKVRFPEATPEQEKKFIDFLEKEIPKWDLTISLDRFLTTLELVEKEQAAAQNFKHDPPKIMIVKDPAVLIIIEGEPRLEKITNTKLERVINTPYLIVLHKKTYYLNGGQVWMEASDIMGPWKEAKKVPKDVKKLTPPEDEAESFGEEDERMPQIIISTEPAELLAIDGEPDYKPVVGNELLYVTNTESNILMEIESQQYFILLSGRWYASKSFEGPWTYVAADELPESFAKIPEDSENGHLLVHVGGTEQAKEAVLDAQIPQTSAIKRDSEGPKVEYDGEPKFENVEGTSGKVEYAVNTPNSIFKVKGKYYCCSEAVWYVSGNAKGPWAVCDDVPDEIYTIPPENPHYNVKYVYVYDTTPDVVYVGYYPGYMGSYIYGPVIVYGTGWWYRPWWGVHYYPYHYTWGFNVRWNPWYGWTCGFGFSTGPFHFHVGIGGPGYGWWGPARPYPYPYRGGARAAYRAGYRHGYRHGYQRPGINPPRPTPYRTQNNIYNRSGNAARNAPRARTGDVKRTTPAQGQRNNVYTDRNGNVHRRTDTGWQTREKGKWSSSTPSTSRSKSQLERQNKARTQGANRSSHYRQSASRGRAGGRRR